VNKDISGSKGTIEPELSEDGLILSLFILKDTIRKNILAILFTEEEDGITFKDLSQKLKIPPTRLAYHLKVMSRRGLIFRSFIAREGRRDFSCYHLTEIGQRAAELSGSLIPQFTRSPEGSDQGNVVEYGYEGPARIQIFTSRTGPRCIVLREPRGDSNDR